MFERFLPQTAVGPGRMGRYEDTHRQGVDVAVKLMTAELQDPVFRERMKREKAPSPAGAGTSRGAIHDYGEVDGQILEMRLGHRRPTACSNALRPADPTAQWPSSQIAAALDAAHADGVMHRRQNRKKHSITATRLAYLKFDFGIASTTTDET